MNKLNLRNQKELARKKYEKIEEWFSTADPYYCEMLEMVKQQKIKNKEIKDRQLFNHMRHLMRDPFEDK